MHVRAAQSVATRFAVIGSVLAFHVVLLWLMQEALTPGWLSVHRPVDAPAIPSQQSMRAPLYILQAVQTGSTADKSSAVSKITKATEAPSGPLAQPADGNAPADPDAQGVQSRETLTVSQAASLTASNATEAIGAQVALAAVNAAKVVDAPENPTRYTIPISMRLKYQCRGEIKGFPYFAYGELRWQHDASRYSAQLEISHFLLGSRTQSSTGAVTDKGLQPDRFTDSTQKDKVTLLDPARSLVHFGEGSPDQPLLDGAQDQLSVFLQLGAMLAGAPERYPAGATLSFQAVGTSRSEQWDFEVGNIEPLSLPGGDMAGVHLRRTAMGDEATTVDIWLAPSLGYLPVRIRLSQGNGDFVEQLLRGSQPQ